MERHVIIKVHFGRLPLGELVAHGRQRLQRSAFELLEQCAPRDRLAAERTIIDQSELFGDGCVGFGECEELAFAQRCQNPMFCYLNSGLDRRLIARMEWPGWQKGHTEMLVPLRIAAGQVRVLS